MSSKRFFKLFGEKISINSSETQCEIDNTRTENYNDNVIGLGDSYMAYILVPIGTYICI